MIKAILTDGRAVGGTDVGTDGSGGNDFYRVVSAEYCLKPLPDDDDYICREMNWG